MRLRTVNRMDENDDDSMMKILWPWLTIQFSKTKKNHILAELQKKTIASQPFLKILV
jgi:hypothetical protein